MVQLATEQRTFVIKRFTKQIACSRLALLLGWLTLYNECLSIPNGGRMWFRPAIFIWRVCGHLSSLRFKKGTIEKLIYIYIYIYVYIDKYHENSTRNSKSFPKPKDFKVCRWPVFASFHAKVLWGMYGFQAIVQHKLTQVLIRINKGKYSRRS
jgi:hypothetical protein